MKAYVAQVRTELVLSLRQGEQMLVSLGIPVLILVFFSLVDILPKSGATPNPTVAMSGYEVTAINSLVPSVLALAVMSTAMVSLGIGTGFERYYKVLKRLGVTPLGRPRLVAAKITMVMGLELVQLLVIVPIALLLGWQAGGRMWQVVPAFVLGTAAFAGIGLLLAGTLRGPLNLAVCNALYLVLLLFGGIMVPVDRLPDGARGFASLLPSGALSEVLHFALTPGAAQPTVAWAVLLAWAIAMPLAAMRWFRWE